MKNRRPWTASEIEQEVLKFQSIKEWKEKSSGSYQAARKLKLLPKLTEKIRTLKPSGHWTKENVLNEALKYETVKSWRMGSSASYSIAHRNGWLKEAKAHMTVIGNKVSRLLYVYEFGDNRAYIGLTGNDKRRKNSHLTSLRSPVFKHIKQSGNQPEYRELTTYLPAKIIADLEIKTIQEYKDNGWKVLNSKAGGQLGASEMIWTKEECALSAKPFNTRGKWKKAFPGAYHSACRHGWIDEITSHMKYITHPNGTWTMENVLASALKYKTKGEWHDHDNGATCAARKNGWYEMATAHMPKRKRRNSHSSEIKGS